MLLENAEQAILIVDNKFDFRVFTNFNILFGELQEITGDRETASCTELTRCQVRL